MQREMGESLNPIAQIEPEAQLENQKRTGARSAAKSQKSVAIPNVLPQQKRDSHTGFAEQQHATRLARGPKAV